MQLEELINTIKEENWMNNFLIIFSLILPGFCYFYFVKNELFQSIDFSKLIILSIFYSIPIFFVWYKTNEHSPLTKLLKKNAEKAAILKTECATIKKVFNEKFIDTDLIGLDKIIHDVKYLSNFDYQLQLLTAELILIMLFVSTVFGTTVFGTTVFGTTVFGMTISEIFFWIAMYVTPFLCLIFLKLYFWIFNPKLPSERKKK